MLEKKEENEKDEEEKGEGRWEMGDGWLEGIVDK